MNNYGQPLSTQYGDPNSPDALDSAAAIAAAEGPWQQTEGQDFGGEQARQQQQQPGQAGQPPAVVDPLALFGLLQGLAAEIRGQGAAVGTLNSQLQYLSRQVAKAANTGATVPPEIQAQIQSVVRDAEERRLEGMTDEEKAAYYKQQLKSQAKASKRALKAARQQGQQQQQGSEDGDDTGDFTPGAIFTPDSPVAAAVSGQYQTQILPTLQVYAEAQGYTLTEEIRAFLDRDPVDVHEDGTVRWDQWLTGARQKLQQIGAAVKARQQGSPARAAGNALQPVGRPSGGAPSSEPDFFKSDMDSYIAAQLSKRRR